MPLAPEIDVMPASAAQPKSVQRDNVFDAELEQRLVRYASIDTQSDEASTSTPTTECQFDLLRLLVDELKAIGADDVQLTEYGAVLAEVESNAPVGVRKPRPIPP